MNTKIAAFDTEDDSEECLARDGHGFNKQITKIAAMTEDGDTFVNDGDVDQFCKWVGRIGEYNWYAFNQGYDLGIFRHTLDDIDVTMVGGRIISSKVRGIKLRDAANLWPSMTLKKVGKGFGIEKLERDVRSNEYVLTDVRITLKAACFVRDLMLDYGVECVPSTIGGCAAKIYSAMFNKGVPHVSDQFVKQAYYGGRVEIFTRAYKGLSAWEDVNSQYPYCMLRPFPVECAPQADIQCEGVAKATVRVSKNSFICPLPVRTRFGACYPHGVFTGWWTTEELRQDGVQIEKLHECWGSTSTCDYYSDYIQEVYKLRCRNDKESAHGIFYKLLMNNLYGRLGMSGLVTMSAGITEKDFDGVDYIGDPRVYGNKQLVDRQCPLPELVNYLHAAIITGRGRAMIGNRLQEVGDKAIYCDTDSCCHYGESKKDQEGLGQWKMAKRPTAITCYAPKMYETTENGKTSYRTKGTKHAEEFICTGRAEDVRPYKFRESVALFEKKIPSLGVWRKVVKENRSDYSRKKLLVGEKYFPKAVDTLELCDSFA